MGEKSALLFFTTWLFFSSQFGSEVSLYDTHGPASVRRPSVRRPS